MRLAWLKKRLPLLAALMALTVLTMGCVGDDDRSEDLDIAYVSANPPSPELVSIQGTSLDQQDWPITEPPRPDFAHIMPTFSPDGELIAFERRVFDDGDNVGRLFVVDPADGFQVELTDLGHDERCRVLPRGWDENGERILFLCDPVNETQPRQIGYVDLDGNQTTFDPTGDLTEFTDVRYGTDDQLVALATRVDGSRSVVTMDADADDADPEAVFDFDDGRFVDELQLSPDGRRAALIRASDETSRTLRPEGSVVVVDLDEGTEQTLLAGDDGDTAAGHHSIQRFHPDGDRLLVATGGFGHGPGALRLIDVDDDGDQTILADDDDLEFGTIRRADISPDGDSVIFSDNDSREDAPRRWTQGHLFLVDTDGDDLQRLDDLSVPDQVTQPTFNPQL